MFKGLCEILYFVDDLEKAVQWYALFFSSAAERLEHNGVLRGGLLSIQGTSVVVHPSDQKMPSGHAGQVAYWKVDNFAMALQHANNLGAVIYRGPINISTGEKMCQVKDPFGNLIGIQGS